MIKRFLTGVAATVAVVVVVLGLKLFGLAPDDVFSPRNEGGHHFDIPFGSLSLAAEDARWLKPLLLVHILCVPAVWHLCRRAGYTGWFSLAMLVPLANVVLLYFLAFAEWPTKRAAEQTIGTGGNRTLAPVLEESRVQEKAAGESPT
jgi:hypothetical protein